MPLGNLHECHRNSAWSACFLHGIKVLNWNLTCGFVLDRYLTRMCFSMFDLLLIELCPFMNCKNLFQGPSSCPSVCPSVCLSFCTPVCLSISLSSQYLEKEWWNFDETCLQYLVHKSLAQIWCSTNSVHIQWDYCNLIGWMFSAWYLLKEWWYFDKTCLWY
jgi:hypothetical protein